MKVGEKIAKPVEWVDLDGRSRSHKKIKSATGKVVYIHPKGRFYTLEFTFPGGSYRESFSC